MRPMPRKLVQGGVSQGRADTSELGSVALSLQVLTLRPFRVSGTRIKLIGRKQDSVQTLRVLQDGLAAEPSRH